MAAIFAVMPDRQGLEFGKKLLHEGDFIAGLRAGGGGKAGDAKKGTDQKAQGCVRVGATVLAVSRVIGAMTSGVSAGCRGGGELDKRDVL